MRAFKFRLQPVLDLKGREKEDLQQLYRQARQNYKKRRTDLNRLEGSRDNCLASMEVRKEQAIDPREREQKWFFIKNLKGEIREVNSDVIRLKNVASNRHNDLVEKLREEKSLEKLKEKRAREFKLEQDRADQKNIDEMGQQLFHLQKGEGFK